MQTHNETDAGTQTADAERQTHTKRDRAGERHMERERERDVETEADRHRDACTRL